MVEATAGALGTMVTCVLLYPVDIAKLHMQAGKSKAGALATMRKIVAEDSFSALYKGLPPKAVHVIINNYLYFYIYEWLKAKRSAAGLKASTLVNTALGVIAGVANLTVTLPLDASVREAIIQKLGSYTKRELVDMAMKIRGELLVKFKGQERWLEQRQRREGW